MTDRKRPARPGLRSGFAHDTRLERFICQEGVDAGILAEAAGMSRQSLRQLRLGRSKAREESIARLVVSLRRILGKPVSASDLFYLGEAHDDATPEASQFLAYSDTYSRKGT